MTYTISKRAFNRIKVLTPDAAKVSRRLKPPVMPSIRANLVNGSIVKPLSGVDILLFGRSK